MEEAPTPIIPQIPIWFKIGYKTIPRIKKRAYRKNGNSEKRMAAMFRGI
jgi:hypothetical protein